MKLIIDQISKTYPNGVKALDHISIELNEGMFGLLGPNGAGKSSLMRTLATLQFPDQGSIAFNGIDIFQNKIEYRKQLGYLPQDFGVYPKESAVNLLNYFAILKGISSKKDRNIAVDRVLELTNLTDVKKKSVSTYSGGMKQRFGIAQLLLNDPKMIIVDEPTAGLDPAERSRFLNVLRSIGSENIVLFSTHLVEDVRELCQDMAIINKGKLISQKAPKLATDELHGKIWETSLTKEQLKTHDIITLSSRYNDNNEVVNRVFSKNQTSADFISCQANLEDFYFLSLNEKS